MFFAITVVSPNYEHILISDPTGQKLIYAGIAMMMVGGYIIHRIINIEV